MSANICIYPNCQNKRYSRGLCNSHYNVARGLIRSGKTTWEKLEANKKALPNRQVKCSGAWFLEDSTPEKTN